MSNEMQQGRTEPMLRTEPVRHRTTHDMAMESIQRFSQTKRAEERAALAQQFYDEVVAEAKQMFAESLSRGHGSGPALYYPPAMLKVLKRWQDKAEQGG